jgi:hypothetical protein
MIKAYLVFFQLTAKFTIKNCLIVTILAVSASKLCSTSAVNGQQILKNYCTSFAINSSDGWRQSVSVRNKRNTSGNSNGYGNFTNIEMPRKTGKGYFIP